MKLLIVEDNEAQLQTYSDNIESFNRSSKETIIEPTIIKSLSDAKKSLLSPDFDGAIIDLKLSSNTTELEGIEVVEEIENNQRFPIFIVSGNISQIDDKEENAFFKKRNRDSNFKKILSEIVEVYQTGITKILGKNGEIDEYLSNIFWKHLSNSMDMWTKDATRTPEEKQKSLLRHTISHMLEYIDEDIDKYHPSEFYITKPIKRDLFTGDIVTFDNNRFLTLTPSCDIIKRNDGQRNASKILFCRILSLENVVENYSSLKANTGSNNSVRKKLNAYIENKKQNYHFIPKSNFLDAGLIDFQDKVTINSAEIENYLENNEMVRIATVSMPFLKDIISRFSNYFSRQGSPDFNTDEVYKTIFE